MDTNEAYKNKVIERLALKIADGLEAGELTAAQASEMSSYILENIDKTKNNLEIYNFLEDLAVKWPLFSSVVAMEQGQVSESVDQEKVQEIEGLVKENKIDEALQVAQDVNNNIHTDNGGVN